MSVAIITGSAGLIGSEASRFFAGEGFDDLGKVGIRRHIMRRTWRRRAPRPGGHRARSNR